MSKKYELTDNTKEVAGHTLHQIKALKSFGVVYKGDLGGWIENYGNLSQNGTAWVGDDALVYGNAHVSDNAQVFGRAQVSDNAWVGGNAWVSDYARVSNHAQVYGNAQVFGYATIYDDAKVYDNSWVSGSASVSGKAKVYGDSKIHRSICIREDDEINGNPSYLVFKNSWSSGRDFVYVLSNHRWHVGCFDGTGEELIKKAYKDSKLSGKMYEMYVNFAKQVVETQQQKQSHKGWLPWLRSY